MEFIHVEVIAPYGVYTNGCYSAHMEFIHMEVYAPYVV